MDNRRRSPEHSRKFAREVQIREKRKIRARKRTDEKIWFGLGMFGLVGWSVAVPTLIGIAIGVWIDLSRPGSYSWTLMLLVIGMVIGCLNAWFWIQRERRSISECRENFNDRDSDDNS